MSLAQKIAWYGRRVSVMRPGEITHRVAEQLTLLRLHAQYARHRSGDDAEPQPPESFGFCTSADAVLPELPWNEIDEPFARRLLNGDWGALGFDWRFEPDDLLWHRAPDTGRIWPRRFFGRVPYRAGNPCGDARVAWEPARLQAMVDLALIADTQDEDRSRAAIELLESAFLSWLAQNPPLEGIHYVSAMECGLRIISVCHAVDLVRGRLQDKDGVWRGVVRLVETHASLIENRLSLKSSAGNHTIAECAGLVYAGILFPEMSSADRWRRLGEKHLASEAQRQILPDGGSLEQAFWYLLFVTELAGLVLHLLAHAGEAVPAGLEAAFNRGRAFLRAMGDDAGSLPDIGDRDDGRALSSRLALVFDGRATTPAPRITFPEAGYTLMRRDSAPDLRVLFDHGPLGMPPLFGHGHSDALSVTVRSGSRELIVDPGTFTYTGDPVRRRYFRSTEAHNTATIDGQDQAQQENAFMWSSPYRCALVRGTEAADVLRSLAMHNGYRRLGSGAHWRGIELSPTGLLVWDRIESRQGQTVRLQWHCAVAAERLTVAPAETWQLGADFALGIIGADVTRCESAGAGQTLGWRSTRYGRAKPIWTIIGTATADGPCEIITWLSPTGAGPSDAEMQKTIGVFRNWSQENRNG